MAGITKRFPGVLANDDVTFEAAAGEVHALLGENGAGKTTLSNILTGLYRPDEGEIELYGEPVRFHSPRDALDAGICMVHQHFRLVEPFSVAENVVLGDHRGEGRRVILRSSAIEERVDELSQRFGLAVNPKAKVWQLSVGEQQRVEILKALYRDAKVLIMDEPTAVLTPQEAETLFETLRAMAGDGKTVIFISHKLYEVKAVADRVTVLRGGRTITTVDAASSTSRSLASLMVGREIDIAPPLEQAKQLADVWALEVDGLTVPGDRGQSAVRNVSFAIREGEIVGVAGVAGNGQRELAEALSGMRDIGSGSVSIAGRRLRGGDPREAILAGVAHVPEDRLGTGLAPSLSVTSNVVIKTYRRRSLSRGPLLALGRMRDVAVGIIRRYDVKTPGPGTPVRNLSGGNLQKLILGREFEDDPLVLVVAQPTRGLDVGAIETVHAYLRGAAAQGVAILLMSEDLDEIRALADRILVIYEGEIVGELHAGAASIEELGYLMAGGTGE
jgi:general nucleoside transport system ATP-binding protein